MSNAHELLAVTTATGQSDTFEVERGKPMTLRAFGDLSTAENVGDLQYKGSDNGWEDAGDYTGGAKITLTNVLNAIIVEGAGQYRVDKDATTGAIGIEVVRRGN